MISTWNPVMISRLESLVVSVGVRFWISLELICCVEAECHFCYLRDSSVYVHESCCLGNQRHPLTYVGLRRFWYGPLPNMVADFRDTRCSLLSWRLFQEQRVPILR